MSEKLRFQGKITGARISKTADWWSIAITVEMPDEAPLPSDRGAVGIDVGLNRLATLSSGQGFENQRFLRTAQKKLRQANKRLHRRVQGSANRNKARRRVARLHDRIRCLRDDVLHKLTTWVADTYALVGIESLHIKGLMKNRRLARSFSDAAIARLLTLLETKLAHRDGVLVKVDRFFPSTKRCHACGWRWEAITLADRLFVCRACGQVSDRDGNAAQNILKEALRLVALLPKSKADPGIGSDRS